jgi:hypothetical protein
MLYAYSYIVTSVIHLSTEKAIVPDNRKEPDM